MYPVSLLINQQVLIFLPLANKGVVMKLHVTPPSTDFAIAPGEVLVQDDLVLVGCGSESALELIEVQPASKTPMSAKSWMNGQSAKVVLE